MAYTFNTMKNETNYQIKLWEINNPEFDEDEEYSEEYEYDEEDEW